MDKSEARAAFPLLTRPLFLKYLRVGIAAKAYIRDFNESSRDSISSCSALAWRTSRLQEQGNRCPSKRSRIVDGYVGFRDRLSRQTCYLTGRAAFLHDVDRDDVLGFSASLRYTRRSRWVEG